MTENPVSESASARPVVMVLFGGRSSEHQISCATAAGVLQVIDRERWDVIPVGITQEGEWVLQPDDPTLYGIRDGKGYTVKAGKRRVSLYVGDSRLHEYSDEGEQAPPREIDVVLPLLHGPYGEDGTVQGLFELCNLRYVGCGVNASAVSMDKYLTKTVLGQAGIPVGDWRLLTPRAWARDPQGQADRLVRELGLPLFVKPCRAGSSMGITRVTDAAELPAAIKEAQNHDPRVIVEASAAGREVECGVLQRPDGSLVASPLGEIMVSSADFYDYETKYFAEDTVTLSCPADLPDEASQKIRDTALIAFDVLECEGLARVDFFYNPETGDFMINEVNTLPGFTPFSMYPTLLSQAGVEYRDLIDTLLEEALTRPLGLR